MPEQAESTATPGPAQSPGPASPALAGPSPAVRWILFAAGLLLLALAGVFVYTDNWFFSTGGRAFVRLPGMQVGQYYFFPFWVVLLVLPALLFAAGYLFPAFRAALRAPWRSRRFAVPLAIALGAFVFSMFPAENRGTYIRETGTTMVFYLLLAGTGTALLLAGIYRWLGFLERPVERIENWLLGLDRRLFVLLLFGFTFLVANLISFLFFAHIPHVEDSIAQVFQARIFASGRLWLQSPRFPDFFDYTHIINNGRWYSQYSFLHSLLLVLGVLIGAPWIINPLLGALTVPLIYILGRDLYGERTGRLAGILAALCPFIFNMSAEYMNHSSALLFSTLFLIFYFRTIGIRDAQSSDAAPVPSGRQKPAHKWLHPLLAGLALGLVANVRPYTALGLAAPFAVYGIYLMERERGRHLPRFVLMVLAAAAATSLLFVYNWLTNGDPFLWGYVVKWGPGHEIGFGKSAWGAAHTPLRGLINTLCNLNRANKSIYEWPIPSLLPLALLFGSGTRDRRDWLLLSGFGGLVIAFFFYWFENTSFGPRFLYESSAAIVILTVRGIQHLGPFLRGTCNLAVADESTARFLRRLWPVLGVLTLGITLPPVFHAFSTYHGVSGQLVRTVRRAKLKNALVFCGKLGHGFSANSLNLDGDVVYAKDYGLCNPALTLSYPDREYYYGNWDTLRRLEGIEYGNSRLKRALDEMGEFLANNEVSSYRTVIWPFNDIPLPQIEAGPRVVDPREMSREIFSGRQEFDDYLPAIACWVVNDNREHLRVFSFMNDLQNVLAGGYKFTLLSVTSEGTGAVYEISFATGRELTVPPRPTAVPLR